jgi:hypothetical protein
MFFCLAVRLHWTERFPYFFLRILDLEFLMKFKDAFLS